MYVLSTFASYTLNSLSSTLTVTVSFAPGAKTEVFANPTNSTAGFSMPLSISNDV